MEHLDGEHIKDWTEEQGDQRGQGRGKRLVVALVIIAAAIFAVYLVHLLRQFEDYAVVDSVAREDSAETTYLDFCGNLLKYNRDGAFYTEYKGKLIWNYTYEMKAPKAEVCGEYVMIYDKGGTQLSILSSAGVRGNIKTSLPIVDADVTARGTVAVLMQEDSVGYVEMYDMEGRVLASGELHGENSGYPVAVALSSNGERLMISMVDLRGGDVKSTISFYDFGNTGKDAIDNLVATYSYADRVIPQIAFVKNDKAIAFGDGEVIIFKNDAKCRVDRELFFQEQMKSIFYNDSYFGIVADARMEDGTPVNRMTVYSMNGFKKFAKDLEIAYHDIELMDNNEIMVTNGENVHIYTMQGIRKFAYVFETSIYKIIPERSSTRYIFLVNGETEFVKLQ